MFGLEQFVVKMSLNGAVNDGLVADNTLRAHKARPAAFSISHINNRWYIMLCLSEASDGFEAVVRKKTELGAEHYEN